MHVLSSGEAAAGEIRCEERGNGTVVIDGNLRFGVSGKDRSERTLVRVPSVTLKRDPFLLSLIKESSLTFAEPGLRTW